MRIPWLLSRCTVPVLAVGLVLAADAADPAPHSTNNPAAQDLKKLQLGPGLKIDLTASEPSLQNPVAFSIDGAGRFFIVETHRYRNAIFDITANTPWLLDDLSFRTVNDRAAFLARTFATNFALLTNDSEIIRLVEDRDGDGHAETASLFADGFNASVAGTAAGILAQGSNVWFTCIPDLWRLDFDPTRTTPHSTGGESRPSTNRRLLASGLGVHISVSGHDVHGLTRGPDGRIYFSFGDRGICVTNREGEVLNVPDTGGVLRCEPDGASMEIYCIGLRNPQELAFDDYGNLWTVDNDTAGADPCRVLHLLEGADYGWRGSYQHMKGFGPWVQEELWRGGLDGLLPPAGTVSQGPAGLAFHPGTGLGGRLTNRFVHADFPGGIWAYTVKPRGASYEIAGKEKLLWNCWPTDVDFGPDGALYVLDWVQGWTPPGKGRIYRIDSAAPDENPPQTAEVRRLMRDGMTRRNQEELLKLLGHADRRVRLEAQWELAGRGTNSFAPLAVVARQGRGQFQRLHALWGVRQLLRVLPMSEGAEKLASLLPLLEYSDPETRGHTALLLGEAQLMNADEPMGKLLTDPSPRVRLLALQAFNARWRHEFPRRGRAPQWRVHFSAGQKIAGRVADTVARAVGANPADAARSVGATISANFPAQELNRLLPANREEPFLVQAAIDFLVRTRRNNAFESHYAIEPSLESALVLLWANRRHGSPEIGDFFTNAEPRLVLETARAINDEPIPDAYPALAALLEDSRLRDPAWGSAALSNATPAGPFSSAARRPREQVLLRALNAHYRLGDSTNANALANFARTETFGPGLRAEALFLLGAWQVLAGKQGDLPIKPKKDPNHGSVPTVNPENWPGWFDRVVGLWRPLPPRSPQPAQMALGPYIETLILDDASEVAEAAIQAALKLNLPSAATAVLQRMTNTSTLPALRKKLVPALAQLNSTQVGLAVQFALADPDADVRASALGYLDRLESDRAQDILGSLIRPALASTAAIAPADTRIGQAAFGALRNLRFDGSDRLVRSGLTNLVSGNLPPALELELIEAANVRTNDATIRILLAKWREGLSTTNELAEWKPVLFGGDRQRGRDLFFEKAEVQCSRCHQVKNDGGTVGPRLDGVAGRQTREQILESILRPNKAIAPGFENVIVTLKNGSEYAGVVKAETATELRLDSPGDGLMTIAKADLEERRPSLSAMPEDLGGYLTQRELRDLIEFLASLK